MKKQIAIIAAVGILGVCKSSYGPATEQIGPDTQHATVVRPGTETRAEMVNLNDCDWKVTAMRSEASVMREIDACVGATGGVDKEYKSENGPLSVITVGLKAGKAGRLDLIPELFLVRDGGLYGVYRPCRGLRVVDPKPSAKTAAFHPPSDGRIWPGHAGQLRVVAGQSVAMELLFDHMGRDDAEILAASPAATMAALK